LGLDTAVPYRAWFEGRQVRVSENVFEQNNQNLYFVFLTFAFALQVAGWTQVYGDKLSFATIRGASHEAPFSQPKRSLVLLSAFLAGKPLPEVLS
jgi:serine carboxypeptidase-like clade 2